MKLRTFTAAAALLGALMVSGTASATIVAKISAGYETSCQADGTCLDAVNGGAAFNGNLSGTDPTFTVFDDPSIFIFNTTAFDFTGVTIQGQGYQGSNDGITQSPTNGVPTTIAANSVFQFSWDDFPGFASCGQGAGNLFAYDYDDTYGCSTAAQPGNVKVLFNATWNGQSISALFSPNSNLTGGFVGFQGLDQNGFAETSFDNHSPGVGAHVADIVVGSASFTPEPATWALMLIGAGMMGAGLRMNRRKALAA